MHNVQHTRSGFYGKFFGFHISIDFTFTQVSSAWWNWIRTQNIFWMTQKWLSATVFVWLIRKKVILDRNVYWIHWQAKFLFVKFLPKMIKTKLSKVFLSSKHGILWTFSIISSIISTNKKKEYFAEAKFDFARRN